VLPLTLTIERGYRLKYDPEGVSFVLPRRAGEAMQAFCATKDLQNLQTVSAFAFFDCVLASALWAHGILL
jgi:hypothetical protein